MVKQTTCGLPERSTHVWTSKFSGNNDSDEYDENNAELYFKLAVDYTTQVVDDIFRQIEGEVPGIDIVDRRDLKSTSAIS